MAIIDSSGLFLGDRLAWCSDEAQLHWPRLYAAANNYARMELNYSKAMVRAYANFKRKPTEAQFWQWIKDYRDNFLLFVYQDASGQLWGQWQTNERYLPRYKTAEDRRSPTPPIEAQDKYRNAYLQRKSANSINNVELADLCRDVQSCAELSQVMHTGVGVGVGVGKDVSVATQPHPADAGSVVPPEQEIYKLYPRKEGSAAALVAIEKAVKKLVKGKTKSGRAPMVRRDAQKLLYRAVDAYARSPVGSQADKTKIPHPATWFNQERWDDDQTNWRIGGADGSNKRTAAIVHGRNEALAFFGEVGSGPDFHGRTLEAGGTAGREHEGIHGRALAENLG